MFCVRSSTYRVAILFCVRSNAYKFGAVFCRTIRIRFTVVSEPDDQDADCEDVGVAFVSIPDILKKQKDVKEQDIDSKFFLQCLWFLSLHVLQHARLSLCWYTYRPFTTELRNLTTSILLFKLHWLPVMYYVQYKMPAVCFSLFPLCHIPSVSVGSIALM